MVRGEVGEQEQMQGMTAVEAEEQGLGEEGGCVPGC
jgi:hypothetical protein